MRTTKVSPATGRGPRRTLVQRHDASASNQVSEDHPKRRTALAAPENVRRLDGRLRLPPSGFTYSLTLSSKCFSTFPHGTCLLSVSPLYRSPASGGVYHRLEATLSSSPTLGRSVQVRQNGLAEDGSPRYGPVTLSGQPRSSGLRGRDHRTSTKSDRLPNATFPRTRWGRGFSAWLLPVRSPLLGESLLVSFPPLNDMLKFGG